MTYAAGKLIQAVDYNSLIGSDPSATANRLNTTWATGSSTAGYGQPALANVSTGNSVAATSWANIVNTTSKAALHQGSSITSIPIPATGNVITYNSALSTNLSTVYNNRFNAAIQGATLANTITLGTTWSASATFTHTVTFANGDAARYFFNSGGQLKITCSHANNTAGINFLFNCLASNIGTIVLSAPSGSATANIAGVNYKGVTQINGNPTGTIVPDYGYYGLTTSDINIFVQTASTGPAENLGSFILVKAKTNGTQGTNGDNGSIITITTFWYEDPPSTKTVGTGSTTTLTAYLPETTYLANTWGTISIAGSVTSS